MHRPSNQDVPLGGEARPQPGDAPSAAGARTLPSDELLQGRKAIAISHNGAIYRLQATRLGKLILTK